MPCAGCRCNCQSNRKLLQPRPVWSFVERFFNRFRLFRCGKPTKFVGIEPVLHCGFNRLPDISLWQRACDIAPLEAEDAMRKRQDAQGFTLMEMVVVLAVIAILAAILTPIINSYVERARLNGARSDVKN